MTIRTRGFGVAMWLGLTTAGVVAATLLGRQRNRRQTERIEHERLGQHATQGDSAIDETLDESFPASDPPSWSSAASHAR